MVKLFFKILFLPYKLNGLFQFLREKLEVFRRAVVYPGRREKEKEKV